MVRPNNSNWRNWLNHTLQELWKDGTYKTLWEKHMGEAPDFYMFSPYMLQPGIKSPAREPRLAMRWWVIWDYREALWSGLQLGIHHPSHDGRRPSARHSSRLPQTAAELFSSGEPY